MPGEVGARISRWEEVVFTPEQGWWLSLGACPSLSCSSPVPKGFPIADAAAQEGADSRILTLFS